MREYRLLSLSKTDEVPDPYQQSGNWYRYEIGNDVARITGFRCGSSKEVKEHVEKNIKRLNNKYVHNEQQSQFVRPFIKSAREPEVFMPS